MFFSQTPGPNDRNRNWDLLYSETYFQFCRGGGRDDPPSLATVLARFMVLFFELDRTELRNSNQVFFLWGFIFYFLISFKVYSLTSKEHCYPFCPQYRIELA